MLAAATACGPAHPGQPVAARHGATDERSYVAPPAVLRVQKLAGGGVSLFGMAAPRSRVRLATPAGEATIVTATPLGAWRIDLPPSDQVGVFGLSMLQDGRTVQAQGYLAVTPEGVAAQLRAGAGALVLSEPPRGHGGVDLLAADFDRKGGAVISGAADPSAVVSVMVDANMAGKARADATRRFDVVLNAPLAAGPHTLAVIGGRGRDAATLAVRDAAAPSGGPFRAERVAGAWGIDWLTPGGGVQSTVIFDAGVAPS